MAEISSTHARSRSRGVVRSAGALAALCLAIIVALAVLVLAALSTTRPAVSLGVGGLAAALAAALTFRAVAKAFGVVAAGVLAVGFVFVLIAYPVIALLALAVAGIALTAVRSPLLAVFLAALLFESEGVVKILLTGHGVPFSNPEAFGAAALDLALAVAVGSLLWWDRLNAPRAVWEGANRVERVIFGMFIAWLAVSVVQIAQAPSIVQGAQGFRLTQAYAILVLAGVVLAARFERRTLIRALLVVGGVLAGYASLRIITGLFPGERAYAISRNMEYAYGTHFRAIGSFGSTVALASALAPVFAFSAAAAIAWRRWRVPAALVAGLAGFAAVFTYTRISLVAMALAVGGFAIVFALSRRPGMRSLLAGVVIGALALGGLAGLVVVSSSGKSAERHAQGFVDPAGDQSLQLRFDTWKQALDEFKAQPLGRGVGTVGSAAVSRVAPGTTPANLSTTDNSFLKVLVEQGILGWPLFVLGLLGTCGVVVARAWRAPPRRRAFTLVALCGFASFPLLWLAGEYIEQPGKVLAWLLLGIAVGEAFRAEIRKAPSRPASG